MSSFDVAYVKSCEMGRFSGPSSAIDAANEMRVANDRLVMKHARKMLPLAARLQAGPFLKRINRQRRTLWADQDQFLRNLMTEYSPDARVERLLELSEEVSQIAGSLARLSMGLSSSLEKDAQSSDLAESAEENLSEPEVPEEVVKGLIRARRERTRYLSHELFAEPAWDMLLDLLQAEIAHRRVSVSSLCVASGVPSTTGLRWINHMVGQGLVIRRADPHDGRRVFVELAPEVSKSLRRYFVDVVQAFRASKNSSDR